VYKLHINIFILTALFYFELTVVNFKPFLFWSSILAKTLI